MKEVDKNKFAFVKDDSENNYVKAIRGVLDYYNILKQWKLAYAPKLSEETWDVHFVESLDNLTWMGYLVDGLLHGTKEDANVFWWNYKREIDRIGKRVSEIEKGTDQGRTNQK